MAPQRPGRHAELVTPGRVTKSAIENDRLGLTAETVVTVTSGMTLGHLVADMSTPPMMIQHMEMASIAAHLPDGFVSVGREVKVRCLAANPVGRTVHTTARLARIDAKSVVFEVEAWDGNRKIGDGTHCRSILGVAEFEKRFAVKQLSTSQY